MLEFFNFLWSQIGSFISLLRNNLSFNMGTYTVSFFDIIIVFSLIYLLLKYFVFRH